MLYNKGEEKTAEVRRVSPVKLLLQNKNESNDMLFYFSMYLLESCIVEESCFAINGTALEQTRLPDRRLIFDNYFVAVYRLRGFWSSNSFLTLIRGVFAGAKWC